MYTNRQGIVYLRIWISHSGYRHVAHHFDKENAFLAFKENVKRKPIWATIIEFEPATIRAVTHKFYSSRPIEISPSAK